MKTRFKYFITAALLLLVFFTLCACSCTHVWQEATCTDPAVCTQCGETAGTATGHAYAETVTKEASCTETGTRLFRCPSCEASYTEEIEKAAHTVANGVCSSCSQIIKGGSVMQGKSPICTYTTECTNEGGTEALYIYIPTGEGYIRYQLVHTDLPTRNANTWRLGYVAHVDDAFENARTITNPGAEWEMALELQGRVDFIGGLAHGDEIASSATMSLDGVECRPRKIEFIPFDTLTVTVESNCYDPNAAGREVFTHSKTLIFTKDGVRVEQRVEFKTDEIPARIYFAMMPPQKEVTDYYFTNVDPTHKDLPNQKGIYRSEKGTELNSVTLVGNEGFSFTMTVEKYNEGEISFMISDNGGNNYNKMYFSYNAGSSISAGDVFETVTVYKITYKE